VKAAAAVGGRLDRGGSAEEQRQHRIDQEGHGYLCSASLMSDWRMGPPGWGRFHWPLATIIPGLAIGQHISV
jgi:hypothetical protein